LYKGTKRLILVLILILLYSTIIQNAHAQENIYIYEFYGQGCPRCAKVEIFLEELEQKYLNLKIYRFEIYNNKTNLVLLNHYFNVYDVPENERAVPVVFISNSYFIGDISIINNLEAKINELLQAESSSIEVVDNRSYEDEEKLSLRGLTSSFYLMIASAALVDSINPCAFAVLLILLATLLISEDKDRAFKAGIAFTISIYISYLLFGLGLFHAFKISGLSFWFYKIVGILAIMIGLANIKDYFWYGAYGFVIEIPRKWRPGLKKLLKSATNPLSAFLVGFLVCILELPCTGGPYLLALTLLAKSSTQTEAIPVLLFYNLVFVLPLLIMTVTLYFGYSSIEKTTEWRERNVKRLHLITGIAMLILGIVIVLELL
jgi:cytochrome c biogenesis protein CcdA